MIIFAYYSNKIEDVGVPPEDVEEEVTFICKELSEATLDSAEDVLKAAAWFHCSFERIHAFVDGNVIMLTGTNEKM